MSCLISRSAMTFLSKHHTSGFSHRLLLIYQEWEWSSRCVHELFHLSDNVCACRTQRRIVFERDDQSFEHVLVSWNPIPNESFELLRGKVSCAEILTMVGIIMPQYCIGDSYRYHYATVLCWRFATVRLRHSAVLQSHASEISPFAGQPQSVSKHGEWRGGLRSARRQSFDVVFALGSKRVQV